jgi:RNA polymerase sigma factor (sigma-70 family)
MTATKMELSPDQLYEKFWRLARRMVRKYASGFVRCEADRMDVNQEAVLGIYEGYQSYDPSRGTQLSTRVGWCVLYRVKEWVRHNSMSRKRNVFRHKVYRSPEDRGFAEGMGMALDSSPNYQDSVIRTTGDTPYSLSGQAQWADALGDMLEGIGTPRQRLAARLVYGEGMSTDEAGDALGVSGGNVRDALLAIRGALRTRLADYATEAQFGEAPPHQLERSSSRGPGRGDAPGGAAGLAGARACGRAGAGARAHAIPGRGGPV